MANLLARINTNVSLNNATHEEKEHGAGIYVDFGDESDIYKQGTFKKVIDSMLEQATDSEEQVYKNLAGDVKNLLAQQNENVKFRIRVYNPKDGKFVRNVPDEEKDIMRLDDYVRDYLVEREMGNVEESKKVDYLDMVVDLSTPVG